MQDGAIMACRFRAADVKRPRSPRAECFLAAIREKERGIIFRRERHARIYRRRRRSPLIKALIYAMMMLHTEPYFNFAEREILPAKR